jgi:hypothetical protein
MSNQAMMLGPKPTKACGEFPQADVLGQKANQEASQLPAIKGMHMQDKRAQWYID